MEGYQLSQNPFLNHLVIERLISYLGFQELKAIRGVCKLWNTLATPLFREKAIVKLKAHQANKFLCSDSILSIYRNFVLDSWELSPNSTVYEQFFQKFGNSIREIQFSQCTFSTHKVFNAILQCLPNLEVIVFGGSYVLDFQDEESVMNLKPKFQSVKTLEITFGVQNRPIASWGSMFKYFPNISVLNAQCRTSSNLTEMLQSILESKLQLTELSSFLTEFTEVHLNIITQAKLQLRSLDINISRSKASHQLFIQFLKSSQNSMEVLKQFYGFLSEFPTGFPYSITLTNIKNLELIGDMIDSFEFLKFLPKLTSLVVLANGDADAGQPMSYLLISKTPQDVKPHLNLKSLAMEYLLTPECVTRLGQQISPNLSRLSAHLDDDSIRSVFEFLDELEELIIQGTEVTDEGFTGIPISELLTEHENLERYRDFPYIGNCKKLRKLSLDAQRQENVSDYAVLHGLMDISELTTVDLPCTAISDAGILSLQLKPNMVNVSAKYYIDVLEGSVILRPEEVQQS